MIRIEIRPPLFWSHAYCYLGAGKRVSWIIILATDLYTTDLNIISSFMHASRSKMVFCPQMGGPLYKTTWATLPPPSQQGDVISFALWHLLHVWHFFLLGHFYHIFVLSANIIVGFGVFLSFFAFVISYFCFLLRFFAFWHSLQTVWKKIGSNWRSGSLGQTCLSHNYPSHDST